MLEHDTHNTIVTLYVVRSFYFVELREMMERFDGCSTEINEFSFELLSTDKRKRQSCEVYSLRLTTQPFQVK